MWCLKITTALIFLMTLQFRAGLGGNSSSLFHSVQLKQLEGWGLASSGGLLTQMSGDSVPAAVRLRPTNPSIPSPRGLGSSQHGG